MKEIMMSNKVKRLEEKKQRMSFTLSSEALKIIDCNSKLKNMNKSEYTDYCIKYTAATEDKTANELYVYALDQLKKENKKMNAKIDIIGEMFISYLTVFFQTNPGLPKKGEATPKILEELNKGAEKTSGFLEFFRDNVRKGQTPFMQSIFTTLNEDSEYDRSSLVNNRLMSESKSHSNDSRNDRSK